MTLSRPTVESLAALCGAIPDIAMAVTTTSGAVLEVAERPDAALCPHTFRRAVASWPSCPEHAPCIEDVVIEGFGARGGIFSRLGERWFVSPMGADDTAASVRDCDGVDGSINVLVREDLDFGMSVVRIAGDLASEAHLDDAAVAAYAACLTQDLWSGMQAARNSAS